MGMCIYIYIHIGYIMGCETFVKQHHHIHIDQKHITNDVRCTKSAAIQPFPAHSAVPKSTSARKYQPFFLGSKWFPTLTII